MVGTLLKSALAGVVAALLVSTALQEAMARDAALARDLRQRGERVTVQVSGHEPRSPSCDLLLTGTLASGRSFTARQIHPNGCGSAPAVGTAQTLVVLPDDPTRGLYPDALAARDGDGNLPDEVRSRQRAALIAGLFVALVAGLVQWSQRRRSAAAATS